MVFAVAAALGWEVTASAIDQPWVLPSLVAVVRALHSRFDYLIASMGNTIQHASIGVFAGGFLGIAIAAIIRRSRRADAIAFFAIRGLAAFPIYVIAFLNTGVPW